MAVACTEGLISFNTITNSPAIGLSVTTDYNVLSNNVIKTTGGHAIHILQSDYNKISDNLIKAAGNAAGEYGIYLEGCRYTIVSDNLVDGSFDDGIRMRSVAGFPLTNVALNGNMTTNNGGIGMYIFSGDHCAVTGNSSFNNSGVAFNIGGDNHAFFGNTAASGETITDGGASGIMPSSFPTANTP